MTHVTVVIIPNNYGPNSAYGARITIQRDGAIFYFWAEEITRQALIGAIERTLTWNRV